ncbi:alpha/beta fold hydrolase [Streptomyces fuscigenes]|uniref:alpha/beta fold hydrolase n=1 Tax=Streptomyces fuscigenes TaxID=1528880 RepID=UPI001F43F7EC|nr:alpha/beta hydrolase [Streptomyces fuscigenes]MCF3965274.1 alpha/beta hydrolase [Streptomyces fuscigenes]
MDNVGRAESADGTVIAYRRAGRGRPVIVVGGSFGTAETSAPLAGLLAPGFQAVTYDRRGRGDSGDTAPYAVEREIEDVAALLAAAGGGACVYGVSSGAALALEAAAAGLPIERVAVYEPPYRADPAEVRDRPAYSRRLRALLAEGRRAEAIGQVLAVVGVTPAEVEALRDTEAWPPLLAVAPTLAYDDAVIGTGLVPAGRLAGVTAPALVMDGGASPHAMRAGARAVAASLPRGSHRTLPGQTHAVEPDVLAPVLREFFGA